jgi:hypothetical protein
MANRQQISAVALAAALIALPAEAMAEADMRANDAFQLFQAFCVDDNGSRDRALAVLGNGNQLANRLPDGLVARLQGNSGGVAWAIRSPNNAQLLLGYTASGVCEVRIAEAEEASVVHGYQGLTSSLDSAGKGEQTAPQTRLENDARLTFRSYKFDRSGKHALVAMTTSDKKVGEQQHLITFGFVQ